MNKTISILTICILFSLSFISAFDSQTDIICYGDLEARGICYGDVLGGVPEETKGGLLFEDGKPSIICYLIILFIIIIIFLIFILIIKNNDKN